MSNLKILVVGASITGPTVAYWLARAGAKITVIERFPSLREGGQNIDIRTSAVTVMRKMGIEDAVRSKLYTDLEGIGFVSADGNLIAAMRSSGDSEEQSLISEYEIFRGDLSKILYDLTKDHPNVQYVFGEQVSSMQFQDQHSPKASISVDFANGKLPRSQFDLVIACDGATSRTRAIGFNCGVHDHTNPINSWVAYFSVPDDHLKGSKIAHGFSAPKGRTVLLAPDPKQGNRAGLWANLPKDDKSSILAFREAQKQGTDALKAYVSDYFQGVGWKTEIMLESMQKSSDFYASEWTQVKLPSIHNGRFVLAGDAGYASGPTGLGTTLAMTGAYILAGEIATHPEDVDAALRSYEDRMKPIIEDAQKIPPGVPMFMAPQTAWGIVLRNIIFVIVSWATNTFGKYFSRVMSFWSSSYGGDKYALPDYNWTTHTEK